MYEEVVSSSDEPNSGSSSDDLKRVHSNVVQYMFQDWPDSMKMTDETFLIHSARLEMDDFETDIRRLGSALHQLVAAREDTILKLRSSADYLDSIWFRCKISRSVGTSASVVGGSLTIAGGILTLTTGGLAAPLLIAGIATSSVGAATNIGASVIEKIINSSQIRDMRKALNRDRDLTLKVGDQIENLNRYKDSINLASMLYTTYGILDKKHILRNILETVLGPHVEKEVDHSSLALTPVSSEINTIGTSSEDLTVSITTSTSVLTAVATTALATLTTTKCVSPKNNNCTVSAVTNGAKSVSLNYNVLGPEIFVETGKVVGQNSTKMAGKVIVGVNAAFLVWDAIDLGITVTDLIKKKGSEAGKVLRDKSNELEEALNDVKAHYNTDLIMD